MQSFLVTGGCGFIGSHLCEALLRRGDRVRVLDDLSSGYLSNLPDRVEFHRGDVADPVAVAAALEGMDGCFHLAAIASVEMGRQDWRGTHRVNLSGTINLFDAIQRQGAHRRAAQNGAKRKIPVVYASSAAVYGDCPTLPITEGMEKRPLSAYGADKYGCELHAAVATHEFGIPTIGMRFFNVYGPRQDPKSPYSGVISIFCDRLSAGEPACVFGDGLQSRDFVYVEDVTAALVAAMMRLPADAPVFNVCTGTPTTVLELARTIAALRGAAPQFRMLPARGGEVRHSIGSAQRSRETLGLSPPLALKEGLGHVLAWLDRQAARTDSAQLAHMAISAGS